MSYYANADLDAYEVQLANYQHQHDLWADATQAAQELFDTAYAAWEADPNDQQGNPLPTPVPPTPAPEPQAPTAPTTTYDAALTDTLTFIDTPHGEIIVTPGRYVLTASSGQQFAVSDADLSANYTDTAAPLPT